MTHISERIKAHLPFDLGEGGTEFSNLNGDLREPASLISKKTLTIIITAAVILIIILWIAHALRHRRS